MTKKERGEKWDQEFISCKHHPERRCNRSDYHNYGRHRCWECKSGKRVDGTRRPAKLRWDTAEQRVWKDRSRRTQKRIQANKI